MNRDFYLSLAQQGLRMPIGADLVLQEQPDPEEILVHGERLGKVVEAAARRYRTPLAVPLMDLRLEKDDLLRPLGIVPPESESWQFEATPKDDQVAAIRGSLKAPFARRNQAHLDGIRYIAERTDLLPVGMAIGPFSLMTKLIKDPITPMAMAGGGVTAEEDAGVRMVERCLELAELVVRRSLLAQMKAGARAILICEPAANQVYLSPRQLQRKPELFEHFVIAPMLRLKQVLTEGNVDLIFHDCGELTSAMVEAFAKRIHPVILSLGSSRKLWVDAALVPRDVVLYGNLPTKSFYSDSTMPLERVEEITRELAGQMKACGHPHILGSECDVLHVPESGDTIRKKVDLMMSLECV